MIKNTHIWLADYLRQESKRTALKNYSGTRHIMFCIADHFEPRVARINNNGGVSLQKEIDRVNDWLSRFNPLLNKHHDSTGKSPKYTFFYPIDEFTQPCVELIAAFCNAGHGEVEIHLHHSDDTEESLRSKLLLAVKTYKRDGLLSVDKEGQAKYGFIHGNWALDNSRHDGKWCGVNTELKILNETGCYADFTLPSAPSETQTKKINSIYYVIDTDKPRSHDRGSDVRVGGKPLGDLMLIQGPLMLNWRNRKFGILPRIENGALNAGNPITDERVRLWVDAGVTVQGRPEWSFIKIHNHGMRDDHLTDKFFTDLDKMFNILENTYNDGKRFCLHYVTAREMYNIVKAAEGGETRNPAEYRDYVLRRTWDEITKEKGKRKKDEGCPPSG